MNNIFQATAKLGIEEIWGIKTLARPLEKIVFFCLPNTVRSFVTFLGPMYFSNLNIKINKYCMENKLYTLISKRMQE